jgi:hypothetical protein
MQIVVGSRGWPSRPGWEMFPPMCPFSLVGYRPLAEPQDEAHRPCYQEGRGEIEGVPLNLPRFRYASPGSPQIVFPGKGGIISLPPTQAAVSMAYWPNPYSVERAECRLDRGATETASQTVLHLGCLFCLAFGVAPKGIFV